MTDQELTLYIWPHHWNLPSFDAECLACVLYLQINFSGSYNIVECTDPDLSPTGTLPFLKHGDKTIGTSRYIMNHLSNIKNGDDAGLRGNGEKDERMSKAQRTAWSAYVNTHLKELLNHILYVDPENYKAGVHAALAQLLPIPARYYLPARLRLQIRTELEAVGLWTLEDEEEKPKKGPFDKPTDIVDEKDKIIHEAFNKEKILEKARIVFDILNPLLAHRSFFLANQPTILDMEIASFILVFIHAPVAKNPVSKLLNESYPSLVDHSERILSLAFPSTPNNTSSRPKVSHAPYANPVVQLGRAIGRMVYSVTPL
ncbi:hypothetical protein CPB86DRAFT_825519 [Serendipita vermifera]|nr:hypothetical protein CPB86DRAFT_825519 [Serendipita vermifera]